jgi:3',5'-cyclic AMP phosphodiesterase CpdA
MQHLKFQLCVWTVLLWLSIQGSHAQESSFKFAFFTDIHLSGEASGARFVALQQAIDHAKAQGIDFILSGGDQVDVDGLKADRLADAKKLYKSYQNLTREAGISWYYTLGNHDRYYHFDQEEKVKGEGLFNAHFGPSYYHFDHKGIRFIVLNSVEMVNGNYALSELQVHWLNELLDQTPNNQPIIVSTHVPFLSVYYPVLEGRYTSTDTFANQKQVFDRFADHNLALVLQGHNHLYEEIHVKGVPFITAGAVSASWWGGPFHGTEEGYLIIHVENNRVTWFYQDFGWEAKK